MGTSEGGRVSGRRTGRRVGRRCLAGVALVVAAAGCVPAPTPWEGTPDGQRVGLVGDSLLCQAAYGAQCLRAVPTTRHLADAFAAEGLQTSTVAVVGAHTGFLDSIESFPEPGADRLVVALGTNDLHVDAQTGESAIPIETAKDELVEYLLRTGAGCNVLVNVYEAPVWSLHQTGPAWNAFLAGGIGGRNGEVVSWAVVDWHSIVAADPARYLGPDGVHHTEEGRAAYRQAILDGVTEHCDAPPAEPK